VPPSTGSRPRKLSESRLLRRKNALAICAVASLAAAILLMRVALAREWDGAAWSEPSLATVAILGGVAVMGGALDVICYLRPGPWLSRLAVLWAVVVLAVGVVLSTFGHESGIVIAVLGGIEGATAVIAERAGGES